VKRARAASYRDSSRRPIWQQPAAKLERTVDPMANSKPAVSGGVFILLTSLIGEIEGALKTDRKSVPPRTRKSRCLDRDFIPAAARPTNDS